MNYVTNLSTDLRGTNPTPIEEIINSHLENDREDVESLREEDLLDLTMAEMSEEEAKRHADACSRYLTLNSNIILSQDVTLVKAELHKFKQFLLEATRKRSGKDRYITALNITFGAVENDVKLILRPVYLQWLRYDVETQKDLYHASDSAYGNHYKFVNSDFQFISKSERDRMVSDYKNGIKIVHKDGGNHESFRLNVDVESILIPLQTIYTVICNTEDFIGYITQAVRNVQYDRTSPIKHIVMVSGYEVGAVEKMVIYANRSHLCPPCSNIFGFDLA